MEIDAGRRPGPGAGAHAAAVLRSPTLRVVSRRLLLAIPLLFVVSALSFLLVSLTPGDAAQQILGPEASAEAYQSLRHDLALDRTLPEQYWQWLSKALHGDLGASVITGENVSKTIGDRLPVTLSLVLGALLVTTLVGTLLGVFSAVREGWAGRIVDAMSLLGFALPGFWVGAVLVSLFAVRMHWLPAVGYVPFAESPSDWLRSLILPIAALALHSVAVLAKQTREAMLDVLTSEHIRMARANGIPPRFVFLLALKNAAMRIVTIVGLQAVALLGGTLFVEQVFALPGLGYSLVNGTLQHDLPVVQGITVFFTIIIVAVNLVVDLTYSWLDPRVRTS